MTSKVVEKCLVERGVSGHELTHAVMSQRFFRLSAAAGTEPYEDEVRRG